MTRNLKLENIILIFSQHLEYGHGTATSEKKLNVAVDFMMRVTDDEQSVEIFSAALKVWKWNKSEWTRCSLRSLVRQSFWSDITKWTLWCCVLCFFMGYLVDFGILKRKQQKATLQCGSREASKQVLSVSVGGNIGRSVAPSLELQIELHNNYWMDCQETFYRQRCRGMNPTDFRDLLVSVLYYHCKVCDSERNWMDGHKI